MPIPFVIDNQQHRMADGDAVTNAALFGTSFSAKEKSRKSRKKQNQACNVYRSSYNASGVQFP